MRNKELAVYGTKPKTLTTRELAVQLGTDKKVIIENARKYLPNKIFEHGRTAFWTEEEITVLIEGMRQNNSNQHKEKGSVTGAVTDASTSLTPALKIKKALELMQEGYEEELRRLEAEKQFLSIKLDEAEDWYSIKRMQKLNPDVNFNWRLMKRESEKLGHEVKKVFDQNYGEVNAYHRDVYESLYFDTLEY